MNDFYAGANHSTRFAMNSVVLRNALMDFMRENNLTACLAAARLGISKTFFTNLKNGRRLNVGATTLARIAVWTGNKVEDFIIRTN